MDTHFELPEFSGLCRLFPLPNVVLFPHVILPLHIFEPRYRQMTEDALAGDGLVTIVQACAVDPEAPWAEPVPIRTVGCLGRIIQHERLANDRLNMLLLGCKRVRLTREIQTTKLYRMAEAAILDDEEPADSPEALRTELAGLFREVLQIRQRVDPDLARLLDSDVSLGILSDIVAHALDVPGPVKQVLLEEHRVAERAALLHTLLYSLVDRIPHPRHFPHPFSLN